MSEGEVDIKFTLTAEEQDALKALRATSQGLDAIEGKAKSVSRALVDVETALQRLAKGPQFQGSASNSQIAAKTLGHLDPATISRAFAGIAGQRGREDQNAGLRAEMDKLRQMILSSPERQAGATRSYERYASGLAGLPAEMRRKESRSLNSVIKEFELGDVSDPITKQLGRIVRQRLKNISEEMKAAIVEFGGNKELMTLAASQGVNIGSSSSAKQWMADRGARNQQIAETREFVSSAGMANARSNAVRAAQDAEVDRLVAGVRSQIRSERVDTVASGRFAQRQALEADMRAGERWAAGAYDGRGRLYDGYNTSTGAGARGTGGTPPAGNLLSRAGGLLGGAIGLLGKVGQPLLAGAYFGNEMAAAYNQRVGVDMFESLKGIEPRYREYIGLEDNFTRQPALRERVRNKALSMGMETGATSSVIAEIEAAAGSMSKSERRDLVESTFRLHTIGGGDPNTLASGLLSMEGIFGKEKTGGVARSAALFKAAADDAKFSATTLAQLGPDALAYLSQYGYSPEQALAMLVAPSIKTGRPENFFTGMKYVATGMGNAEAAGWVDKGGSLETKLERLSKRSPEELMNTSMFGREGFSAITNLIATRKDVAGYTQKYKGITGDSLMRRELGVIADPLNMMSRLAQSVDVVGGQGYELLMEQGGPEGYNLAGKALVQRLAMEGQKLDNPVVASLTDKTKLLNLQMYEGKYANMLLPHMLQALAGEGPSGALKAQALKLATGQVQLDDVDVASWQGVKNAFGAVGTGKAPVMTRASTGADAADYLKMVSSQHLFGMTADEYGQYITLKNSGRPAEAESLRSSLVSKYGKRGENRLVDDAKQSATDIARANEIAGAGNKGPYATITGPIDAYIEGISHDEKSPFRIKAAEQVRDKLNRAILTYDKAKDYPLQKEGAWANVTKLTGGFAEDVDAIEMSMLKGAFGAEFTKRQKALSVAKPESSAYADLKSQFDEIDTIAKAASKDGVIDRKELVDAAAKLGLGKANNGETEIGDKSINALAAALAKAIQDPPPTDTQGRTAGTPASP